MRKLLIGICVLLGTTSYPLSSLSAENSLLSSIVAQAQTKNIDPALAAAFAEVESSFNPAKERYEQRYKTYSVGLFQVFIPTARALGFHGTKAQLKVPETNIRLGLTYLQKCSDQNDSIHDIACCYNAGEAYEPETCRKKDVKEYIAKIKLAYSGWIKNAHLLRSASAQK